MREDLLHFIWKYKKLQLVDLLTSKNESVQIVDVGQHNLFSGPDFFNAQVYINGQLWAGNIEIHIKSSDWYAHHHEEDPSYNNVILHVVWEDDIAVFRKDGSEIPALELKNYIPDTILSAYQKLFDTSKVRFINCQKEISQVDPFLMENWTERLYLERLERKSEQVFELLKKANNDWEQVLFKLLLKNFGLKINGESFLSIARVLDASVVRKIQHNILQLESAFFGSAGLLAEENILDNYFIDLSREYIFLKTKFDLQNASVQKPQFFKLRPPNFPTIRLSQLANLYGRHQNIFASLIEASTLKELYSLFDVTASAYWNTHFTFGKESKRSIKKLTKGFIDLLIINTVLPLKFCYARQVGSDINEEILAIISEIKKEENNIVSNFEGLGVKSSNAKISQAILQLHTEYCLKNRCLECAVGNSLLRGND